LVAIGVFRLYSAFAVALALVKPKVEEALKALPQGF
jgi:hypothetical protein